MPSITTRPPTERRTRPAWTGEHTWGLAVGGVNAPVARRAKAPGSPGGPPGGRDGAFEREGTVLGKVGRSGGVVGGAAGRAEPIEHSEQPAHLSVEHRLVDRARPHGTGQRGAERSGRTGHLEIETGARRVGRG